MKETTVRFVERENGPERLVCEAEIVFGDESGPLAGLRLVGFQLWKDPSGDIYVTFPSKAFGAGGERRYFDYVRSVDGTPGKLKALKIWMLERYQVQRWGGGPR